MSPVEKVPCSFHPPAAFMIMPRTRTRLRQAGDTEIEDPVKRKRRITQSVVRRLALSLPEAQESSHAGRPDFRVRNRIFATLPPDSRAVVLKCVPANVDALVTTHADVFWNEWHGRWLGVRLDRVTMPLLKELLVDAWCVAAPKRLHSALPP
jgi:hypothetical protein